jgi:pentachlorophenol monooxygenase/3-(3-hydroxy-phenyl)propionate hydroxylase
MPDVPVTVPGIRADRIRELARYGILLLTGPEVDTEAVRRTALDAITSPLRIHRLEDVDATGLLGRALRPSPCDVWIIRPDSHISAVVDGADPRALREALRNTIAAPGSEAARVLAAREVPPGPPLPPREPAGPAGRKEPVTA